MGSALEKLKVRISASVEEAANWCGLRLGDSKVRIEPDGTVATGGSELSHLRCREDFAMWKVWDSLGGGRVKRRGQGAVPKRPL